MKRKARAFSNAKRNASEALMSEGNLLACFNTSTQPLSAAWIKCAGVFGYVLLKLLMKTSGCSIRSC